MKIVSAWTLATLAGLSSAQKFVKLSFDKSVGSSYSESSKNIFQKRDSTSGDDYAEFDLANQQTFYSVDLKIGTPAQEVTVLVDTGSSDLWVMGSDNSLCSSNTNDFRELVKKQKRDEVTTVRITLSPDNVDSSNGDNPLQWLSEILPQVGGFGTATQTVGSGSGAYATGTSSSSANSIDCSQYGTFNESESSTFKSNHTGFEISYGDDSYASGVWGTDTLHIGSVNVSDVSIAVANYTNSTIGVLGIGLPGLETTYSGGSSSDSYQYANFPIVLKDNGVIEHIAYSLYLDEPDASTGSILFGAVDHSKYVNGLYTVPLVNIYSQLGVSKPIEFDVTFYGIGVQTDSENVTIAQTSIPALLDSGTTISYFPPSLLTLIASQLGATYSSSLGYYTMNCVSDDDSTLLVFDFGGFHITAPLADFQSQISNSRCLLMMSTQADRIILGDVFLQHAYVVYDLENLEISMGQANFDSSSSDDNIEVIGTTVPSAVQAPSYSSSWVSTNMINTRGNIFADVVNVATGSGNSTTTSAASVSTSKAKTTTTAATTTTRSRSTSTTTSDETKKNIAPLPYSINPIAIYSFVLFIVYFI